MVYAELAIGTKIRLKQYDHEKGRPSRTKSYTVTAKYPHMCMVEDRAGRKKGVAMGELIMNRIITQEEEFENLRRERNKEKEPAGWHKEKALGK